MIMAGSGVVQGINRRAEEEREQLHGTLDSAPNRAFLHLGHQSYILSDCPQAGGYRSAGATHMPFALTEMKDSIHCP